MTQFKFKYPLYFIFIVIVSCKKPYAPPAITTQRSYLVVEGVINPDSGSTIIKLSRTVNLSSAKTANPETGAILSIQASTGNIYHLVETNKGTYATGGLNLDITKTYRLNIKTSNNQQYASDYVPVKVTPPIDSVGFLTQASGVQLYVNTHDANNNTRYYRWDYTETWQFHAQYFSAFITNGTSIVTRRQDQFVYYCFANDASSSIILGSSAKLSKDIIYQNPITFIASNSEKVGMKYSIMVNEYALTGDAYNFYSNLKKNTEQLGSIFDAQPSNINSNIHNISNPAEPVIGYVSACTVQSKRIFISNSQLPSSWVPANTMHCELDSNWFARPGSRPPENQVLEFLVPITSTTIPVSAFYAPGLPNIIGYIGADVNCVDCTLRGTTTTPVFWK